MSKETQLTLKQESEKPVVHHQMTPAELLAMAVSKDLDIDKLSKLMELQKSWQADQARKLFFEAMTKFQSVVPELIKNKEVKFGGDAAKYSYTPLASIIKQIKDVCRDCGLSYRWEIQDDAQVIKVTCLITHVDGHAEQTTMTASPDTSGSKNAIQARGSAIEYMKRYTLIGALGLSTADSDIDGQLPKGKKLPNPTEKQFVKILERLKTGDTDMAEVSKFYTLTEEQQKEVEKLMA
jgi:hypothetical protein